MFVVSTTECVAVRRPTKLVEAVNPFQYHRLDLFGACKLHHSYTRHHNLTRATGTLRKLYDKRITLIRSCQTQPKNFGNISRKFDLDLCDSLFDNVGV